MWYDINKTLSHNCLLNFVVGQRGVGKTYSFKRRVIKNYLEKGEQFVYLRRYQTELESGQIEKFFDDIMQEFPDVSFGVKGGAFYINEKQAGFYIALSKAAQYKSVPYPRVSLIGFDEFIIDQGMIRYLNNEVITFNEMYSTIARLRDVRVVFLSNAITFTNPYFIFFNLSLQQGQRILKRDDILLEWIDNPEYIAKASQTRFGKIIAGTDYGNYAVNNKFLRDNDVFVSKMPGPGISLFNLRAQDITFTVYRIMGDDNWYISSDVDPSCKHTISLDTNSHNEVTSLKGDASVILWFNQLKQVYFSGNLRFTTVRNKNILTPYLRRV